MLIDLSFIGNRLTGVIAKKHIRGFRCSTPSMVKLLGTKIYIKCSAKRVHGSTATFHYK